MDRSVDHWKSQSNWPSNSVSSNDVQLVDPQVVVVRVDDEWAKEVWSRVAAYGQFPPNWDSYGASALQAPAVLALVGALEQVYDSVNSSPRVSMLTDGGISCEWFGADAELTLYCSGSGEVWVEYESELTGESLELPAQEVVDLQKRVWETSLA